jgi:hypothetical protein
MVEIITVGGESPHLESVRQKAIKVAESNKGGRNRFQQEWRR